MQLQKTDNAKAELQPGVRIVMQRLTLSVFVALTVLLGGCSPRHLIIQGIGNEMAAQGDADEEDLGLAREASAFYLKLSESLLRESPGNLKLAQAVSGGFTQYAFAFVAFEAERIESKDAKAAQLLNERAKRLYLRAHHHAMAALEASSPGFAAALAQQQPAQWPVLSEAQVGLAYWAAASWGAAIALSKDNPDTVADLPLAFRLATLAWKTSPSYGEGALASLMGTFEASIPGGSVPLATTYFDAAIAVGAGRNAGAFVAKAEGIARAANDRRAFEALLQQALDASAARRSLANTAMRERALWLLASADDIF
jgi:predicted anti-sigma-YlaC factor YlaD